MHLAETHEQESLRKELREYFDRLLTREVRDSMGDNGEGNPEFRRIVQADGRRRLARARLAEGVRRPGPAGRPTSSSSSTRCSAPDAPFPFVTDQHGRADAHAPTAPRSRRHSFLPGILAGELNFAIGYTEPEAGTDLASLRTRAVLDGDEWVINGNKVFTSGANQADYVWLACRTDPDAPKHKGISIIIVPTDVARLLVDADRHRRAATSRRPRTTTTCACRRRTSSATSTAAGS